LIVLFKEINLKASGVLGLSTKNCFFEQMKLIGLQKGWIIFPIEEDIPWVPNDAQNLEELIHEYTF